MVIAAASPHLVRPRSAPRASPKGTTAKRRKLYPSLLLQHSVVQPCIQRGQSAVNVPPPLRWPLFALHVIVINTIIVTAANLAFLRNMDMLDITTDE